MLILNPVDTLGAPLKPTINPSAPTRAHPTAARGPAAADPSVTTASPWYATWWGILGLGVAGFGAYRYLTKPPRKEP
jgi:hypothetical protein